jgi:hypothetical protein
MGTWVVSILVIYQGNKSLLQPVIITLLLKRKIPQSIQDQSGISQITKMGIPII